MAAPPPKADAARETAPGSLIRPRVAGQLVLFESWLRHEVTPNRAGGAGSVSFNYSWFYRVR